MSDIKAVTAEKLESFIYNESTNEQLHRYALALEMAAGKQVLDIVSGEGYGANLMASVAAQVIGVDTNAVTVALANRKYKRDNLKFLTGETDKIPCATQSFDIVVSFENIEHHDQHEGMMQEIKRVLKPGGLLIISSTDKLYYSDKPQFKNAFHIEGLYHNEFESLLKKYFKNISFLRQRSFWGSIIVPQSEPTAEAEMYTGNYDGITHTDIEAKYIIALASDSAVPLFKTSLFNGETVLRSQFDAFRELIGQKAKADVTHEIKNSKTYKVGDAIIRRLRLIKNLFKR